jgi:hypothetical protein
MAKAVGISVSSVQRIWRAHGLQPHRVRQFKLSNDPQFVAKLRDIVGLYVNPPDHAIVLSVDEKSQIQALDRTQPVALLSRGRLKRGVFRSLQELKDAIHSFIADTNANPKPFIWTKDPNKIIAAVRRGHRVLDSIHE